jgi:hypothetical protein
LGPQAFVELTGLRTPCVLIDRFQAGLKRQLLSSAETGPPFESGVLGVVQPGGPVSAGDTARVRLTGFVRAVCTTRLPHGRTGARQFRHAGRQFVDPCWLRSLGLHLLDLAVVADQSDPDANGRAAVLELLR